MGNIEITFKVKSIIFRNNDSRYSVIRGLIKKHNAKDGMYKEMTIIGTFPVLYKDDLYSGVVKRGHHIDHGAHLELQERPELITPENKTSLSSFIKKRIGTLLSTKKCMEVVNILGLQAISEIRRDYKQLTQIEGIDEEKAEKIYEKLLEHESFELLAVFIQSINLPVSIANKIYETYQHNSLQRIRSNPYCICLNEEISFKTADIIAKALKRDKNDKERVSSAIRSYLKFRRIYSGDICVYKHMILNNLNEFLNRYGAYTLNNISPDEIEEGIKDLISKNLIRIETDKDGNKCIYESMFNSIENNLIKNLTKILTEYKNPFCRSKDIDDFIQYYEHKYYPLDIKQKEAIYNSIQNGISILTGGPGTGKTATTNAMVQCIKHIKPNASILLLAPTGKASERLSELTNMLSSTIHRGIKLNPYNGDSELEEIIEDFVFIDESSMIDAYMFERLTSCISPNTRVVFIGDVDQLPSVGAGLILRDMIDSEKITTTRLTKIFRQAETSTIVSNAHKIIKGYDTKNPNGIDISNRTGNNFIFWKNSNTMNIIDNLNKSIDRLVDKYGYKTRDICILTPKRGGELGVEELNKILQTKLNPASPIKAEYNIDEINCFRVGDKVIQNKNNYELNVFNGFVGTITSIYEDTTKGSRNWYIEVEYPNKEDVVVYTEGEIEELELAYCMSIHKSQGSEFPVVIMPIHLSQKNMLNRNLIYTGVTRAKEKLIMIGEEEALNYSINHKEEFYRISRIKEKIMDIK